MTDSQKPTWSEATKVLQFENVAVKEANEFTWTIDDWSGVPERALSPIFEVGGFDWQLLMFPQGNPGNPRRGSIALYLNSLGPTGNHDQPGWHACCSFALTMWSQAHPTVFVTQSSQHRFTARITDWGYNEFALLRGAFVRAQNADGPLISSYAGGKLQVQITVRMEVLEDPTGVLWHDFTDYDSRESTGYTGLVNQGATCYLNSLLQSLYFTKAFRSAVYSLTDSQGVTGGLQRIFYKLSTSHPPVDTTDLTKSFGWDTADAFTQHDVQELARVLMDRLESKMKGTEVDGFLSKLFVGQMKSYIKCINVPFESARTEDFWDVQLNVRGMKDVYESFANYCAEETLMGDNQYQAGEHGLQDAVKGVVFESLPPVLHLQLKRYEFDWVHETQVKINDRYEYPLEIDLSEFVLSKDKKWEYELHGVLVHFGDLNAGHYYALIKPEADGGWYRFDDDRVTKATIHEVLDENFGGDERSMVRRVTSAYMLVYIRKDSKDFVLPKSSAEDSLPTEVAERITAEQRAEELRQKALAEQQLYMNLRVITLKSILHHRGPGILPLGTDSRFPPSEHELPESLKVRVNTSIGALLSQIDAGSLWLATSEPGEDTRACPKRLQMIPSPHEHQIEQISAWTNYERPVVLAAPEQGNIAPGRFVFLKKFDGEELRVIGYRWIESVVPLQRSLADVLDVTKGELTTAVHIEISSPSHIAFTKKNQRLVKVRSLEMTAAELNIENGEILVLSEQGGDAVEAYFERLHNLVTLVMVPYDSQEDMPTSNDVEVISSSDDKPEERVIVSICDSYEKIATKVAEALQCKPENLMLRSLPPRWVKAKSISSTGENLSDLWSSYQDYDSVPVVYRVLPVPLADFEKMDEIFISWLPNGYMGPEYSTVALGEPEDTLKITNYSPSELAVWVTYYGKRCKEEVDPQLCALKQLQSLNWDVHAAPLIPEEAAARAMKESKLCQCFHYHGETSQMHGIPFNFAVVPNEQFSDTKKRVMKLLSHDGGDSEMQKEKWFSQNIQAMKKMKFSIIREREYEVEYITDESFVLYDVLDSVAFLGIDHPDRSRTSYQQQAIHID